MDTGSGLGRGIFSSPLRCSDSFSQVAQAQRLTCLFSPSRQKSAAYKHLIVEGFHPTRISSIILSSPLVTSFVLLSLWLLFTQRRRQSSLLRDKEFGRGALWVLLDQWLLGISWAWDKQAAWILQRGGKSNMNLPVSVPLGSKWTFLLLQVHSGADTCSFEATAEALIDVSGVTPSPPGCGVSRRENGSSFDSSFNPQVDFRQYPHTSMCVSMKVKGKQQMCFDYWKTQWDVPSNMESNYFVLHSSFKLRDKTTSFILIWLLSVLKWKFKVWTFTSFSFILWRKLLLTHPVASADHWWMVLRPSINFNSFRF